MYLLVAVRMLSVWQLDYRFILYQNPFVALYYLYSQSYSNELEPSFVHLSMTLTSFFLTAAQAIDGDFKGAILRCCLTHQCGMAQGNDPYYFIARAQCMALIDKLK